MWLGSAVVYSLYSQTSTLRWNWNVSCSKTAQSCDLEIKVSCGETKVLARDQHQDQDLIQGYGIINILLYSHASSLCTAWHVFSSSLYSWLQRGYLREGPRSHGVQGISWPPPLFRVRGPHASFDPHFLSAIPSSTLHLALPFAASGVPAEPDTVDDYYDLFYR